MKRIAPLLIGAVTTFAVVLAGQTPAPAGGPPPATAAARPPDPTNLGTDANGNTMRKALKTGHVSNYDETKVAPYTLPDPLVMNDGRRVATAGMWTSRRAEILNMYQDDIYGRVPANAPKVRWTVTETDPAARDGAAVMKHVTGIMGTAADPINLTVYTPAHATKPVPIILMINFGGGPARGAGPGAAAGRAGAPAPPARGPALNSEPPVAADILARGWGYEFVGYNDIQPDRANAFRDGVIGTTLAPGKTAPAPGEWGTIAAWSWGVSRIVDYFETDRAIDAKHIALQGFSRLGKTVLWAAAMDQRIGAVFSGCAGEMGSALARRDWGETVDDMAQNFPWQFASRFQQWVGRWNDMPTDAHMLIALSAPRPVFITGGTTDQWSDPKGEFLAEVAAAPVYQLLGKRGPGVNEMPAPDTPVTTGDLAFNIHTGGHMLTVDEWKSFLQFMDKYWGK